MTLAEYLHQTTESVAAFARRINRHKQTVWRWAQGINRPRANDISLIEKATNGRVKLADWVGK